MKLLLIFLTFCCGTSSAVAQCGQNRQIIEFDSLSKLTLLEYVQEAYEKSAFRQVERKGIIHLVEYRDLQGRKCWSLYVYIDDRYKDLPPSRWAYVYPRELMLIYEGDENGNIVSRPPDKAFVECLEVIVADRVYQRIPQKTRYFQVKRDGKWVNEVDTTRSAMTGNAYHNVKYIFEPNGTVTKVRAY